MKIGGLYILADDGKTPVPEPDPEKWGRWFEDVRRRLIWQDRTGPYLVSTVFLGMDHRRRAGPPVLWESMVFTQPDWRAVEQRRYDSWEKAGEGHREILARVALAVRS